MNRKVVSVNKLSTTNAIYEYIQAVFNIFNKNTYAVGDLLHLSKAYD